jgi:hypothetical protein
MAENRTISKSYNRWILLTILIKIRVTVHRFSPPWPLSELYALYMLYEQEAGS